MLSEVLSPRFNAPGEPTPRLAVGRTPADRWPFVRDQGVAWAIWLCLLVVVCAFIIWGPQRSVTKTYFLSALVWISGESLYNNEGTGFLYLPQSALLFVPLAGLPALWANLLWRCVTIGLFAWGIQRFAALGEAVTRKPLFGVTTAVAMPLAWSSALNGQATLPMAGLMMAAMAYLADSKWWRAAACLVLAVALKPLALVLLLLSAVLYGPMRARLMILTASILLIPFLTQSPSYVWSQYEGFVRMAHLADQHSNLMYFAQLFGMLRVFRIEVPEQMQAIARLIAAGATLAVCLYYSRRLERLRWISCFYALGACYLMLFNPRTENNTYSLVGPAIGLFLAVAVQAERSWARAIMLGAMALGTVCSWELGRLITPVSHSVWLAPLMCIAFCCYLAADLFNERPWPTRQPQIAADRPSNLHRAKAA
ncbi:MAG TPA: glycosyltransferase 87 family protein [Pirellulales bacterium]|nr:glycosyltransferase 87 family protein [Pirellulales bacterium]